MVVTAPPHKQEIIDAEKKKREKAKEKQERQRLEI